MPERHRSHNAGIAAAFRQQIVGVDQRVPLLDGTTQPYTYLDNAASTPAFRGVLEKVDEFLGWYSSVHRGAGFKSLVSTRAFEQAREIVAHFVGANPETHCVIFGKNTTEALNKLANRLELSREDIVLTTVMEHHSNDLPWRPKARVEYVGVHPDGRLDLDDFAGKLKRFRGRIRLVTTTGASNVTGFMPPVHDMAELAHRYGARILVDCAQLAPHRAIDMGPDDSPRHLDFVALSAHKMYAPYGSGALVAPKAALCAGEPDYRGGGTIELVTLDDVQWAPLPDRDEAGSPNVVGAVALAASIRILSQIGMDAVASHEMDLMRYALPRLGRIKGMRLYGSPAVDDLDGRVGVIPFEIDGVPHSKVAAILSYEGGIGVRDGCFCAHPYVLRLMGISDAQFQIYKQQVLQHNRSDLPGLLRASFGCYNTTDDVDRLVAMLERVAAGDYRGDYRLNPATGGYTPAQFEPAWLESAFSV